MSLRTPAGTWILTLILAVLPGGLAIPSLADSQARIVRLSQVDGEVLVLDFLLEEPLLR